MHINKLMVIEIPRIQVSKQEQLFEVTVVECYNLATEQSYVVIEYGSSKKLTKPCSGKHPKFIEKLVFTFVEEIKELKIAVCTSGNDEILCCLRIQLEQVLSNGCVDSKWTLQSIDGRYAGDIRLVLQLPNFMQHDTNNTMPTLSPASHPMQPQLPLYGFVPSAPEVPQPTSPDYDVLYPCSTYHPTQIMQPNEPQPAILSQLLPYGGSSPPAPAAPRPTAPAYYAPYPYFTYPHTPAGYYTPQPHPHQNQAYFPPPTGPWSAPWSAVYQPPQR